MSDLFSIIKDTKANIDKISISDGQMFFATDTGKIYIDDGSTRQEYAKSTLYAYLGTNTDGAINQAKTTEELNHRFSNITTRYSLATGTWSTTAVTVNSIAYYVYTIALNHVYNANPTVMLGYDTPPEAIYQTAFNLIKYITVDSTALTLKIYAESIPANDVSIQVIGVD